MDDSWDDVQLCEIMDVFDSRASCELVDMEPIGPFRNRIPGNCTAAVKTRTVPLLADPGEYRRLRITTIAFDQRGKFTFEYPRVHIHEVNCSDNVFTITFEYSPVPASELPATVS